MGPVIDQLEAIKRKFSDRIYREDLNPDGVLTCALDEYLKCLDLDMERLEQFLLQDEQKWDLNLKQTKEGLDRMSQSLIAFSSEQEKRLADLLNPEKFIKQQ